MREIHPSAVTLSDLVNLGPEAVSDRLPTALLVELARRAVREETRRRHRAEHRRAERQARGNHSDGIDRSAQVAAEVGARDLEVAWAGILDIPLHGPAEGVTWGTATVDDHEAAAEALELEGATFIRSAAMHRRAVLDLRAAGARTLNESTMGLR